MVINDMANNKIKRLLWLLLLTTPVLMGVFVVLRYGVNMLYTDEISDAVFMSLGEDIYGYEYHMTFERLFAQHSEHRIFFPRLVYITIAKLTDMSLVTIMLVSQIIAAAAYITLCRFICIIEKSNLKYPMMLFTGFLFFSLIQYENMLHAGQIAIYTVVTFTVLSIFFMQKSINAGEKDRRFLALSILCAVIPSFSFLNGLMVWIAVDFVYLLHFRLKAFKSIRFWVWNAFAAVSWIVYFTNFYFSWGYSGRFYMFENPVRFLLYCFVAIGSTLSVNMVQSAFLGFLIVLICLYILYNFIRNNDKYDFLPLALMTFGALFVLSLAVGRAASGIRFAMVSRYTTFSLCIIIGMCLYLFNGRMALWSSRTIITIVILLGITSQGSSLSEAQYLNSYLLETKAIFTEFRERPNDELSHIGMDPHRVREWAALMEKYEAGPFKGMERHIDSRDSVLEGLSFNEHEIDHFLLESIDDGYPGDGLIFDKRFVHVYGWAIDDKAGRPFDIIAININGNIVVCKEMERDDISEAFENPDYLNSGFVGLVDTVYFHIGKNDLEFILINEQEGVFYNKTLSVLIEHIGW